jgi:hypothetical protein
VRRGGPIPQGVPNPPPQTSTADVAEELQTLDVKLKQLKFEYDQYFLGGRPREPVQTRSEVQKIVTRYSNTGIQNTALRFKFNNLCARYYALRRQWDEVLRKIEEGSYQPHRFKAKLHEKLRGVSDEAAPAAAKPSPEEVTAGGSDLFAAWCSARESCGEDLKGVTREKLDQLVDQQRAAIQQRTGCEDVRFRVVVENGKAKLKATPVRTAKG